MERTASQNGERDANIGRPSSAATFVVPVCLAALALVLFLWWWLRHHHDHRDHHHHHHQHDRDPVNVDVDLRSSSKEPAADDPPPHMLAYEVMGVTPRPLIDATEDAPVAQLVRLTDADGRPRTDAASVTLAVEPAATPDTVDAYGRLNLRRPTPIAAVHLEAADVGAVVDGGFVELLTADAVSVVRRERVPAWRGRHTVRLDAPPALRPVVWSAERPVFRPTERTTVNEAWVPNEGDVPADAAVLHSTMGLLAGEGGGLAVDRLVCFFPHPMCARHRVCPVFVTVRLPPTTGQTTGLLFFADGPQADLAAGLGYGPGPELRHMVRMVHAETEEFHVLVTEGLGAPVPTDRPVVIGLQYAVRRDGGLRCTIVHPDGTVIRADFAPHFVPPVVNLAKLWGNPDTDDAFPDPERRLVVHEVRAYPWLPGPLSDGEMLGIHAALVRRVQHDGAEGQAFAARGDLGVRPNEPEEA